LNYNNQRPAVLPEVASHVMADTTAYMDPLRTKALAIIDSLLLPTK